MPKSFRIGVMELTRGRKSEVLAADRAQDIQTSLERQLDDSHQAISAVRTRVAAQDAVIQGTRMMLMRVYRLIMNEVVPQLKTMVDIATKVWASNLQIHSIIVQSQHACLVRIYVTHGSKNRLDWKIPLDASFPYPPSITIAR